MPLPSYSVRTDSFGNYYFGGFQMDSAVEAGYGANTTLAPTQSEWNAFLTAALGSTNWSNPAGNDYYLRVPSSYEAQTGAVSASNYRFANVSRPGFGDPILQLNSAVSGGQSIIDLISADGFFANMYSASTVPFAVANQHSLWVAWSGRGTGTLTTAARSMYFGWAKDPVFPVNTPERVRNLVCGRGTSTALNSFVSPVASGSTTPSYNFTNSVITCSVSTPGANTSDLCFLNSNYSYLNTGSAHNAVFVPGTGLTLGQIYRIPPAQDPDGNTEQNIWLCAGQVYGWNGSAGVANAGYKLIRVWSNNIT